MECIQTKFYGKNFKQIKPKKEKNVIGNKRGRDSTMTDSEVFAATTTILEFLKNAIKNNEKGTVFDRLEKYLTNCYYQKQFIHRKGLSYLKHWLTGKARFKEVEKMLDIIESMKFLTIQAIEESDYINIISKISNGVYPLTVKRKANRLIGKWNGMKQIQKLRLRTQNQQIKSQSEL